MVPDRDPDNRSEEALIEGVRQGRPEAFEGLVLRHQERVFAVLRRSVPADEVEDMAQEAFLRAYRRIGGYRGEARFETWLFAIVRNLLIDRHRRLRRAGVTIALGEETGENQRAVPVDPGPRPDEEFASRGLESCLRRALARLGEKDRLAVLLHDQEGMSADEVARVIGGSAGAVRVRLFRARRRLRAILGEAP
jgi:RNA polymerase sigma-70 factor (ECF subfamily)